MKRIFVYLLPLLLICIFANCTQAQITGTFTVCVGATTTLSDVTPGGTWTSATPSVAVVGLATGTVFGLSAGTSTITYTAGSTVHTVVVTVNALPSAGIISGLSTVCVGAAITLTPSVSGGTWSATNANATVASGMVSGVVSGKDTIIYTVVTSCGTASTTKIVTINALPVVSAVTGASSVCMSSTITLIDATPGGIWSSSNPSATVTSGGVVTGVFAATDTISYTVTNTCGSTSVSRPITINPLPSAGVLSGAGAVCIGSTITFSSTVSGGLWTASNATATVSGGVVTGITSGVDTISYSVTNGCGTATVTATVAISPAPSAGSIFGASTVCEGASTMLTATTVGGVWLTSTGMASVSGGLVTGTAAGVDTIRYVVTTGCGTDAALHVVTVDPLPDAGFITGPGGVCSGSSISLAVSSSGGAWSSDDMTIADVDGSGNVDGLLPGSVVISYLVTNACGADTASYLISVDEPAGPVILPDDICTGSLNPLANSTPGGSWSSSNPTTAFIFGASLVGGLPGTATITYTVINGCGTTTSDKVIDVILCLPLNDPALVTAVDELKVFPDPSSGTFTLNYVSATDKQVNFVITNAIGEKVHEFSVAANQPKELTIDVAPGIYFINAVTSQNRTVKRIMIN